MMVDEHYRLNTSTLAIMTLPNEKPIPVTIPQGALIRVVADQLHGTDFVSVKWDGKTVMMFTSDLRERGTRSEQL
jgi:hypothetical protein